MLKCMQRFSLKSFSFVFMGIILTAYFGLMYFRTCLGLRMSLAFCEPEMSILRKEIKGDITGMVGGLV